MRTILKRIAMLEGIVGQVDESGVIAFMVDGASDDDVTAARNMFGDCVIREEGEPLAAVVARLKTCQPRVDAHLMFFEYAPGLRERLGKEHLPETLPNSWPVPMPSGHACHVEHRP